MKKLEGSEAKVHRLVLVTSLLGNPVTSVTDGPAWGPSTHSHTADTTGRSMALVPSVLRSPHWLPCFSTLILHVNPAALARLKTFPGIGQRLVFHTW